MLLKINSFMNSNLTRDNKSGKILETKENLTLLRKNEADFNFLKGNPAYSEIEKQFGKYLFLPYAIPKIEIRDLEFFKDWFFNNSKHSIKLVKDLSSGLIPVESKPYLTIDSIDETWNPIFSKNSVPEIFNIFPELFEQIHEYMPWVGPDNFRWNIWSSCKDIIPHRDFSSCLDLPIAMRIKLFDSNEEETLKLLVDPIKDHNNEYVTIPKLTDTNTFGWNNLRTKHKSVFYGDPFRKILFIWRDSIKTEKQLTQLADLLEKSVEKYKNIEGQVLIDTNDVSDYINI
jgi:hypothetical protein